MMKCHTCDVHDYVEFKEARDIAMSDGEAERVTATVLECPKCVGQGLRIPANLLKRHAQTLCMRKQRLSAANITWMRKRMRWTQEQMGRRLGGAALNTVYRWESGRSPMPASAEYLLRILVAIRYKLPVEKVAEAVAEVPQAVEPKAAEV
jgi:DNA-binding transcriptional regulator YiaG